MATRQYHYYLNENKIDDSKIIEKLDELQGQNINLSALVRDLLKKHFFNIDKLRQDYIKHEVKL